MKFNLMWQQGRTGRLAGIFRPLMLVVISLLTFQITVVGQSVQIVDSEVQLAAILCRNTTNAAANALLLNRNAQFLNAAFLHALHNCASSAQQSPANSIVIYKLTARVADELKRPDLVAAAHYYIGRTYTVINDFENAIQAYETSKAVFEETGNGSDLTYVLADLARLYLAPDNYEKAQTYSEQSLAIARQTKPTLTKESLGPIEYGQARSLHTLGEIELFHGNNAEALNKLREAVALYERLNATGASYNIQTAEALIALSKLYGVMGKYARAFSHLSKAHQVSRSSGDQNTRANIMGSRGSLFLEQEDYAAAQTYLNESLAIYRKLSNTRQEARVLLNLAVIEQRKGRPDDALKLFKQTRERADSAKLVDIQIAAGQGLGVVLTAKRDFPNALQAINEGLELARRVNAKTREVELLWQTAQTHYAMHNFRESAAFAEQALTMARTHRLPKLTYFASALLGEAYAADNKIKPAITTLKEAINEVEALRDEVAGRQEGRYLFFENKVGPYHTLVKVLTKQGKNFEALHYAERAKGRLLLEAVRNNRTDLKDIYTETEKAEAELLINKLYAVRQKVQSQPDGTEAKGELQNELNAVERELVSFQERLAAVHPELPLRAGPAKSLTPASLNGLVRAGDVAYLEYVVTADTVGIFILKRNALTADHDLKYLNLPVTAGELRRKVNEFHSALAERHPDYTRLGRELYRLLIEPVATELQNVRTVCIIPDEFLWTLPFQALTTTNGNYFIQNYALYYSPSLSVLNEISLRGRQQSSKESLLGFGNPVIEMSEEFKLDLHPLPHAAAEVATVASALHPQMKRILVGRHADEKTFKALSPKFATIHLATHGVLDNRNPLDSYLLLTKTEAETENDGFLHAREIMDLPLNADLAVLSACETGTGRISPGEGVVGMSWAFLVAGARSVVVSQWRVNSAGTSQLMKHFYGAMASQHDLTGIGKSQALREASLTVLKNRRYRHPFYWAGFVLVSSN